MKRTNLILLCLLAYVPLFSQVDTIADNIFVNNGKLGIGISNPITLLHLNGEVPSGDWRNLVKIHNDTDGPLGFTGIMLKTGSGEGFSVVQDYGINYSGSLPEYDWAGCLGFGNNANGFIFHTPSATGSFKVYTGLNPSTGAGYERLRITPEGDIGIGTSTPDVRLRIEDSIDEGPGRALIRLKNLSTSNTSSVSLGLESNNGENGLGLTFTSEQFSSIPDFDRMGAISVNGKGFSVYSTSNYGSIRFYTNMDQDGIIERMRINHDGNVGIGIKNPLSRLTVNGMIHSTSKGFKFPDGTIQTTAASGGDSSYWNLSGNNIFYNEGNIGIGTSEPRLKLHIRDTSCQLYLGYQPAYDGPYINLLGEVAGDSPILIMGLAQKDYDYSGKTIAKADWAYIYGNNYNHGIGILPDLTEAPEGLYLTRGGLIGIGTTNPVSKLEVKGMIHSTSQGFKFPDGTIQTTAASGGYPSYWNLSGNDIYYSEGNIGIGTSEPRLKLHIRDTSCQLYLGYQPAYDGPYINLLGEVAGESPILIMGLAQKDYDYSGKTIAKADWAYIYGNNNNHGIGILPDLTEAPEGLYLTRGGLIGIGTINPVSKLEVNGMIHSTSQGFKFPDGTIQTTAASGGYPSYWNLSGNDIYYSEGNIGIGTSNPISKLEVNGMIHSTSEGVKFPDGTIQTTAASGGDSSYWNLSGNDIYYNEGNIGIGTKEPNTKVEIASGDIFISDINSGIIMKSPDGNCWRGTLDNSGILVFTSIHCPGETQIPINLISTTSKITIFPNPAENTVTIASLDGNFRNTEAIIYTMDGKVVKKNELNGELFIVNISNIPAGSYILRVLNKRGREIGSETILKN